MWIHLREAGCHTLFSDYCDLDLQGLTLTSGIISILKCLVFGCICHFVTYFLLNLYFVSQGKMLFTCIPFKHIRLMAENGFAPPPLGNFADISFLVENFKLCLSRYVCTLYAGALVSDSLLHMLPYQI